MLTLVSQSLMFSSRLLGMASMRSTSFEKSLKTTAMSKFLRLRPTRSRLTISICLVLFCFRGGGFLWGLGGGFGLVFEREGEGVVGFFVFGFLGGERVKKKAGAGAARASPPGTLLAQRAGAGVARARVFSHTSSSGHTRKGISVSSTRQWTVGITLTVDRKGTPSNASSR